MHSSAQLPVGEPLLDAFNEQATLLALLNGRRNEDQVKSWLISQFVNLYAIEDEFAQEKYIISSTRDFRGGLIEACPFIMQRALPRGVIAQSAVGIVGAVEDCVERGIYLYVMLNKFYIPCAEQYGKMHFNHLTLLYGVDKNEQTIHAADNYRNNKFTFERLSFEAIKNAFDGYEEAANQAELSVFTLEQADAPWSFRKEELIEGLDGYLNPPKQGMIEGLRVYELMEQSLDDLKLLHLGSFHAVYEHKKMMRARYEMLIELGLIQENTEQYSLLQTMEKEADQLRFTYLKYRYANGHAGLRAMIQSKLQLLRTADLTICRWLRDELLDVEAGAQLGNEREPIG
ncbi:hypothetical protein PaecuDRAFT_1583 [Paenibacillus curdlanolyticus YK9]|uniref:Butirosin biosynthesis protein H N-terminal domain-containing protein n=1 Tax=Paenibacillus curdlanolyticus YK9 TaxID=717606 RepID=E0I7F9_9BACL|nr:hypothetical protein [Paenibacillus curdlanolyticus]EFM11975.1 hypothetical protein PaecuDRAFT_1583 [Paenibacillus curdlanolyticus YK9]